MSAIKKHNKLIFLHGWGGSKNSLMRLSLIVSEDGYESYCFEMPGHGDTPEMDQPWDMDDFSEWLNKSINSVVSSDEDYVLIGHSFGGKLIMHCVANDKLSPKAIVLINSSGLKPKNSLKIAFWKNISQVAKIFAKFPGYDVFRNLVYRFVIRETDYIKTKNNLRKTFGIIVNEHVDEAIKQISCPTLIIWGKNDEQTPLSMGEKIHESINNSEFDVFEGTHGLPLKNPEIVGQCIKDFLLKNNII